MATGRLTKTEEPVRGRLSEDYQPKVNLRDPLGINALISGATAIQQSESPIKKLARRDMSEDVISAPEKPSALRRLVDALKERQPSKATGVVKEVLQGTAREVASLLTLGRLSTPTTQDQKLIFGNEPFSTETVGREYAGIFGKSESVSKVTANTIGVVAGLLDIPFKGGKILKEGAEIISKLDDTTLIKNELKRIGVQGSDSQIDTLAEVLKTATDKNKIETVLKSIQNTPTKTAQTIGRLAKDKNVANLQTEAQNIPKVSRVSKNSLQDTSNVVETPRAKLTAQQLQETYGSKHISGGDLTTEARAFKLVEEKGVDDLVEEYLQKNGNVISSDRAKSLFPEYAADNGLSEAVQKPSKLVADEAFDALLKRNKGQGEDIVTLLGGGTAAGKSVAIEAGAIKNSSIIYEANLNNPTAAIEKINKALESGYNVALSYVYRDPLDAFKNGALQRSRIVTQEGHLATHTGIPGAFEQIAKKFEGNPHVSLSVVDNSRGLGNAVVYEGKEAIDFISKKKYSKDDVKQLKAQLSEALETARKSGDITDSKYSKIQGNTSVNRDLTKLRSEAGTKNALADAETEAYEVLAQQQKSSDFALRTSAREEERVVSNLESVFAELKGVDVSDLKLKFTEQDLLEAQGQYEFAMESLLDDPARALTKYMSRSTGRLPEVTGTETITSPKGRGTIKNSEFGKRGDQILQEVFGYERQVTREEAQDLLEKYLKRRDQMKEYLQKVREVNHNIKLSKQKDAFIGREKKRLATEVAKNQEALLNIVKAAEKAGFKRGVAQGEVKYQTLIKRLKDRRIALRAIKDARNLTDSEFRKVRGNQDPRFMTAKEFETYLSEVDARAEQQFKKNEERILIDAIIDERGLKKTENLQRAMEFPPISKMSLEQLQEFSDILSKTDAYDEFLTPRMIQTAVNTDLGEIRTLADGVRAIEKQTGLPATKVPGSELDNWLRDPVLAERDPLHKMFITEWATREADMLTRQHKFQEELNRLARASRKSRSKADKGKRTLRQKLFGALAPEDKFPVAFAQTLPENLGPLEKAMTPEEVEFGKFLRGYFEKVYSYVAEDAANRWTLRGVKYSRFKDMYFPHMQRSFFERLRDEGLVEALHLNSVWRTALDDGFLKALSSMFRYNRNNVAIDFNAFGDRGQVLGYEKFFKNNLKREGDGPFSKNASRVAVSYFHAFERKMILDAMTPKIKLLEFLLGERKATPKSITNPDGTEQVVSELRAHINRWINNKKGQRSTMAYSQGSDAEMVVDGLKLFIAVKQLGINILAQTISAIGGEVATFSGLGVKGWSTGHKSALTAQGRKLGREFSGVIGDSPWNEIASTANSVGDTLRSGIFYIFGELSWRAKRQMFLGSLTKEEFKTGVVNQKRLGEIKLDMGKWHPMPEFRSIRGNTSEAKAAMMYTEWAMPIFQNTHFVLVPRLRNMLRTTPVNEWDKVAKTKEFQSLFRGVVAGASAGAMAYLVLHPDKNDNSTIGYMRRKAAQEVGSIIQAMTYWGIPIPFSVMTGFVDQLQTAMTTMLSGERYKTDGPGHYAGDLKGPDYLFRALVPNGIQQLIPEPETPIKTPEMLRKEISDALESGEITVSAAKELFVKEMKKIQDKQKERRFEMNDDQYRDDVRQRIESGELTVENAKKEVGEYLKQKKERDPESFESDSDQGFIEKVKTYGEAIGTDPVTAFKFIFQGESIRRTDNGAIIVRRLPYEESQAIKKERGATKDLILDHTIPLQLGGGNAESNLKLVPIDDWESYTPVENFLGQALRTGDIDKKEAVRLIKAFKEGKMTDTDVYNAVEAQSR